MGVLADLGLWFWRLLPANPILVRVVSMASKRLPHLHTRIAYLGVLLTMLLLFGGGSLGGGNSLAELAKKSTQTFIVVSFAQLLLTAFIAPVFTAGAITQERDSNTFHILLTTPLSNGQIVLGSLVSRLYFVWMLLLSGVPIFCITMIYGGVTLTEVLQSVGLAACTALVTGALAIAISVSRVGTRKTIFSFFVAVAVYLIGVGAIGVSAWGVLKEAPPGPTPLPGWPSPQMSWLAPIHPFLAQLVITGQTPAPQPADVYHYGWPARYLLAYPQFGYMWITTLISIALVVLSLAMLRRGSKEGESTLLSRLRFPRRNGDGEERRRTPRHVWDNPIAWREARTRASAGARSVMLWAYLVGGGLLGIVLLAAERNGWWGITTATLPNWVLAIVLIELAVVLLVVTNTAASTLTRERESQTLEMLLSTPLTSKYIMRGMGNGLIWFGVPLICVPAATLLLLGAAFLLTGAGAKAIEWLLAAICLAALMVSYAAVAAMVGLHFSLNCRKTVQAVMISTGIVIGATAILFGCAQVANQAGATVAAFFAPFSPALACQAMVTPQALFEATQTPTASEIWEVRITSVVGTAFAVAGYLGLSFVLYSGLVKNFDMTVRRQSAST